MRFKTSCGRFSAGDQRVPRPQRLLRVRLPVPRAHAGGHNGPSDGVEVVNPYYPTVLQEGLPWGRVIEAPWAHRERYVLPTPEQAEATASLIGWLTSPKAGQLKIPRNWLGLRDGKLTEADCFRVGSIGRMFERDMIHLTSSVKLALTEQGVALPVTQISA